MNRTPETDFAAHSTYAAAPRECDLVLEGGIAGGVVYPRAILEIARTHRLRNVGGASAGAIAVALAAAAEFGRARGLDGPLQGFPGLAAVDAELARPGVLRGLFEPRPDARPLVDFVVRIFAEKAADDDDAPDAVGAHRLRAGEALATRLAKKLRRARPWLRALGHFERGHTLGGLLGGGAALLLATPVMAWSAGQGTPIGFALGAVCGLSFFAAGAFLGSVLGAIDEALTLVDVNLQPGQHFGLCPGVGPGGATRPTALFDWLHHHVQRIAGCGPDAPPLTFDDLARLPERHAIQARMVTTNLNAQRAHRVPFEDGEIFLYRRAELRALLPEAVFRALEAISNTPPSGVARRLPVSGEFGWFPGDGRMPVVLGVRLSMSFPLVFAAVRLFMVRSEATAGGGTDVRPLDPTADLVECWFSDGGICNNFPLQFFDVWFPERPTFGINLSDTPIAGSALRDQERGVHPEDFVEHRALDDERRDDWAPHELRGAGDFLSALVETLLAHRDNALTRLASYRERVATVRLNAGEGALNLDMSPETIDALAERGRSAAARLKGLAFERHQWVRLRTLLGALENEVLRMQQYWLTRDAVVAAPVAGLEGLRGDWLRLLNLARAAEGTPEAMYPAVAPGEHSTDAEIDTWYAEFEARIDALLTLMERWALPTPDGSPAQPFLDAGRERCVSPQPRGEHRVTSKV